MPIHPMLRDMIRASIGWVKHKDGEPCPVDLNTRLFIKYKDGSSKAEIIYAHEVDWNNVDEYKFCGNDPYVGRGNNMKRRKSNG